MNGSTFSVHLFSLFGVTADLYSQVIFIHLTGGMIFIALSALQVDHVS